LAVAVCFACALRIAVKLEYIRRSIAAPIGY
jgi:hypothetical protein